MLPDHHRFFNYNNAHQMLPTSIECRPPRATQFIHINREPAAWVSGIRSGPCRFHPATLSVSLVGGLTMRPLRHECCPQTMPPCHLDRSKRDYSGIILHVNIFKKTTARYRLCTTLIPWNFFSLVLVLLLIQILWLCRLSFAFKFASLPV